MPVLLLPRTAEAYAVRSAPTIVLKSVVDPWLTATLKRINRIKRPLNSVPQHTKCLTETLAGTNAIWNLCAMMVPRAPESQLVRYDNPIIDALFRFQLMHIQAYVVHVDLVLQEEIAYKLTADTIKDLIEYHKEIYLVDLSANTYNWPDKEVQIEKLHTEFIAAVNKFVYRTNYKALEGIEEDGAGELLEGRSEEVRALIDSLFQELLPPPPPIVNVIARQAPILPSSPGHIPSNWYTSGTVTSNPQAVAPIESWQVIPSTPSQPMGSHQQNHHTSPMAWGGQMSQAQHVSSASPTSPITWGTSSSPQYSSPQYVSAAPAQHYVSAAPSSPLTWGSLGLPDAPPSLSSSYASSTSSLSSVNSTSSPYAQYVQPAPLQLPYPSQPCSTTAFWNNNRLGFPEYATTM